MSKKISSTSNYLGISNNWLVNLQYYGKINYLFYFSFFNLLNIIFKKFNKNKLFISNIILNFTKNLIKINSKLVNLYNFDTNIILNFYRNLLSFIKNNFSSSNLKLKFYLDKENWLSNKFMFMYLDYLFLNFSPKQIFNLLIIFLKNQLGNTKYVYFNFGFKKVVFKGFKIQLKGRYELTRSTLSKNIFFKYGCVTTNSFNKNFEFLSKIIFSKLGKSSIKIWFFYSKI